MTILVIDRLVVPVWLRVIGVRVGNGCRFRGLPTVGIACGARITLGNNVLINSRHDSNPAGLPHATILAALAPDSVITIGDGTGISGASIAARRGVTIGSRVLIGAGACIWDTDFHPRDADRRREHATRDAASAPVTIGDEAFIGARSFILKGVNIGRRAVIGAGAVVTKDVAPGELVGGNPARILKQRPDQGRLVS